MGKPFVLTFTDPDELEALIEEYFNSLEVWSEEVEITTDRDGNETRTVRPILIERIPPTMADLAHHLGVVRGTLWNMQREKGDPDDPIRPVIVRALNRIAGWNERTLYTRDGVTGARFTLEVNHGYGREQGSGGGAGFSQQILPPRTDTETKAIPKWEDKEDP
jgi:hypothetical protein